MTGFKSYWMFKSDKLPGVGLFHVNVSPDATYGPNLIVTAADMHLPNKGVDLDFVRVYNSQSNHDYAATDGSTPSNYGNGWTNTFDAHMATNNCPNAGYSWAGYYGYTVYDGGGARYDYCFNSSGQLVPPAGLLGTTLVPSSDGGSFAWTKKDGTRYTFYSPYYGGSMAAYGGRISSICGRNLNNCIQLSYYWSPDASSSGNLTRIVAQTEAGQQATLNFASFNGRTLLQTLTWPDGTVVSYGYDTNGNLTDVGEPTNGSASPSCPAGTSSCLHSSYAYAAEGPHLLDNVEGPNFFNGSAYAPGSHVAFDYSNPSSGVYQFFEADYFGTVAPTIPDGYSSGPIQATPSTNEYRQERFDLDGAGLNWHDSDLHSEYWFPSASAPLPGEVGAFYDYTGSQAASYVIMSYAWTSQSQIASATNVYATAETDFAYDQDGNVIAVGEPSTQTSDGTFKPTSLFSYDANDNLIAYCDPLFSNRHGLNWGTSAPSAGACHAQAGVASWIYANPAPSAEPKSRPVSFTDPTGYTVNIRYDASSQSPPGNTDYGLPTMIVASQYISQTGDSSTPGRLPTLSVKYDSYGNVISSDAGTGATKVSYDSANTSTAMNRPVMLTDADGVAETASYYANGQVETTQTASEAAAHKSTTYQYDADGNLSARIGWEGSTNSNGAVTNYYYDSDDRIVEVATPRDTDYDVYTYPWIVRYLYDLTRGGTVSLNPSSGGSITGLSAHGDMFDIQEYLPGARATVSNVAQRISAGSWLDQRGAAYDYADRPTTTYALGFSTSASRTIVYDENNYSGLATTVQNAFGAKEQMAYDGRNYPGAVTFSDGTPGRQYSYDADGRLQSQSSDNFGALTYTYDADGRVTSETEPSSNAGFTAPSIVSYAYYPDGMPETLGLQSLSGGGVNVPNLATDSYRADGRLEQMNISWQGITNPAFTFQYSSAGRLLLKNDPSTGQFIANTTAGGAGAPGTRLGPTTISYDSLGRVSSWTIPDGTKYNAFQYDHTGEAAGDTFLFTFGPASPQSNYRTGFTTRNEIGSQSYTAQNSGSGDVSNYNERVRAGFANGYAATASTTIDAIDSTALGNPTGTFGFTYDAMGRSTSATQKTSSAGGSQTCTATLTRNFDYDDHLTGMQFSGYAFQGETPTCPAKVPLPSSPRRPETAYLAPAVPNSMTLANAVCCAATPAPPNPGVSAAPTAPPPGTTNASGEFGSINYTWSPSGHPALANYSFSSGTTNSVSLHWAGDQLLFTTDQNGNVTDLKVGDADLYTGASPWGTGNEHVQVSDRDWTGAVVSGRLLTDNGWLHEGDSINDPYENQINSTYYPDTVALQGPFIEPASDGIWDHYAVFQGIRAYDPEALGFASPDSMAGSASDPMSQAAFSRDKNNAFAYRDPSGRKVFCPDGVYADVCETGNADSGNGPGGSAGGGSMALPVNRRGGGSGKRLLCVPGASLSFFPASRVTAITETVYGPSFGAVLDRSGNVYAAGNLTFGFGEGPSILYGPAPAGPLDAQFAAGGFAGAGGEIDVSAPDYIYSLFTGTARPAPSFQAGSGVPQVYAGLNVSAQVPLVSFPGLAKKVFCP